MSDVCPLCGADPTAVEVLRARVAEVERERDEARAWAKTSAELFEAASLDITELQATRDAYHAFAVYIAKIVGSPGAEDLADKLTPGDLPTLADCVRGEYGSGHAAGGRARFARCITDITRAMDGDERRPETWEDLVAMVRAVKQQRDHERQQANEWLAQLHDLRISRPINVPALAARLQSVREMARDAATTAMARAIEDIIYDMLPRPTGTEGLIEKANTAP